MAMPRPASQPATQESLNQSSSFLHVYIIFLGNVFEPRALDELIPDWKEQGAPIDTPVSEDAFLVLLDDKKSVKIPNSLLPPQQVGSVGRYVGR